MNYRLIYYKIISKAIRENRQKNQGVYFEFHHILPKSIFPLWIKRKSNLVLLTAREHFFCHQLLTKIYPSKEMSYALWMLCIDKQNNNCRIGSRDYEKAKLLYIEAKWGQHNREKELQRNIKLLINKRNKLIKEMRKQLISNIYKIKRKYNNLHKQYKRKTIIENKVYRKIICIETNKKYYSIIQAANELNVKHQNISRVLKGNSRYNSIHGFHFKYA